MRFLNLTFTLFLLLTFQLADAQVIIGYGAETQIHPFNFKYGYSQDASIYTASEMNTVTAGGTITTLAWQNTISTDRGVLKIYLKTVGSETQVPFENWTNIVAGATLVWTGLPVWTNDAWNTFNITDFNLPANQNLMVLVECSKGGSGTGNIAGTAFRYTSSTPYCHAFWQSNVSQDFSYQHTRNSNRPNITLGGLPPLVLPDPPNCATLNSPTDGTTDAELSPTLEWTTPASGSEPLQYKVYFGTFNPPITYTAVSGNSNNYRPYALTYSTTYYWYVVPVGLGGDAIGCNSTVFSFTTKDPPPPPENDECTGAILLTSSDTGCNPTNGTFTGATDSPDYPGQCTEQGGDDDVWYKFVATATSHTIKTNNFFGTIDVSTSEAGCNALTNVSCKNFFSQNLLLSTTVGNTYYIRIYSDPTYPLPNDLAQFEICVIHRQPPPLNDECSNAILLNVCDDASCPPTTGTVAGATDSPDYLGQCDIWGGDDDVWYRFVATASTHVITTYGFPGVIDVSTSSTDCAALTNVGCGDIYRNNYTDLIINTIIGQTYYIRFYSKGFSWRLGSEAQFTICVKKSPVNDECSGAILLTVSDDESCNPTSGTVEDATDSPDYPGQCTLFGEDDDVWYKFVATAPRHTIHTAGIDGVIDVSTTLTDCSALSINDFTDIVGGNTDQITVRTNIGQVYYIRFYSYDNIRLRGSEAQFTICVTQAPPPPVNDECENATRIQVTAGVVTEPILSSMKEATRSSDALSNQCGSNFTYRDVWYSLVVPSSGKVKIETYINTNSFYIQDYAFEVYSGNCEALTYINCNDNGNIFEKYAINYYPTSLMPSLLITGQIPGSELFIRMIKKTYSTDTCYIAAFDPDGIIPLASSECDAGTVTIDPPSGNAHRFVPLLDGSGNLIGELFSRGQDLGTVSSSVKIGTLRQDVNGVYIMPRSITISATNPPTSPVDVYLYCSDSEFLDLYFIDEIGSLYDLKATKTSDACGFGPASGGVLLTNEHSFSRLPDYANALRFKVSSFSTFFLHGGGNPLPVDLLSFNAEPYAQKQVKLTWTVANEANLQKYVIERSADGKHFSCIGAVSSLGKSQYIFMDSAPLQGTNYYRLVSLDHDTKEHYSMIRMVNLGKDKTLALFPNPVSQDLMITGLDQNQQVQYLIYNEMGQLVNISTVSGETLNTKGIDVANLASGQYCIRLVGSDFIQTLKFSKL